MSVGADGTVTHIDGKQVYAFGHRFLERRRDGAALRPLRGSGAAADAIHLVQDLRRPASGWAPSTQDRNTAIVGRTGQGAPPMVPVSITVVAAAANEARIYQIQHGQRPRCSAPLLVQMAVFSTIDATERTVGASTLRLTGEIEFEDAPAPIKLDNMYAARQRLRPDGVALRRDPAGLGDAERVRHPGGAQSGARNRIVRPRRSSCRSTR